VVSYFPNSSVPAGRCPRCAFPPEACLCMAIPRLRTPYRFLILRHASEIPRMTNSGRWAALALEGAVIHDHARGAEPSDEAVARLLGEPPAVLLFPTTVPARMAEPPRTIVVPDATWSQARHMVQRIRPLQTLPRLALPSPPAPWSELAVLRRSTVAGGMTTLEAIAAVLGLLGEPEAAAALQALHGVALERTLRLKGMWPPDRNRHPGA